MSDNVVVHLQECVCVCVFKDWAVVVIMIAVVSPTDMRAPVSLGQISPIYFKYIYYVCLYSCATREML